MSKPKPLGGVIHTYQKFDPKNLPSPTSPPPDLVSPAFEHLLMFGSMRELSDEELARAVKLDPSQFAGFGPSIESLIEMLRERKRKILDKYETRRVQKEAADSYRQTGEQIKPPAKLESRFRQGFKDEQIRDLERLWYQAGGERSQFARELVQLVGRLGDKYQVDELAGKYTFTGQTPMSVPQALEIKEELETIDRLLKQLEEAAKTAQIGVIDLDELSQFTEPGDIERLNELQQQIEAYMRELAERQGLERGPKGFQLTPKAYQIFQGRLLERIFSQLQAARTGRHQGPIVGEGATELQTTKPYEFGDSVANMDMPASLVNAMVRGGTSLPIRMKQEDIEIHRTRNTPKCATVVLMDMSGSMRYDAQYIHVKRMALALDGLIGREYPGDFLQFVEVYSFAKPRHRSELVTLMPKPVTVFDPVVRRAYDMSREDISEYYIPPHFTNIQHGLQMARRFLAAQDTPNRQVILITDGLPTAHFQDNHLCLLYPPHPATESATMREGQLCHREQITINIFLLPSWSQTREDVQFAYRLAESTTGRVFFTGGKDLDRFVVWDYVNRRREIIFLTWFPVLLSLARACDEASRFGEGRGEGDLQTWILYGANGYTARLIAAHAIERGLRPILAGRNSQAIAPLAKELSCEFKIFALDDPAAIAREISGAAAVLNCAGPFSRTARPMMEACMAAGVHYLDITGEIPVIETAVELGARAAAAGVSLLPAVGFDVVPSDCLAAMLAARLPSATHLQLAFAMAGGVSPGTAKTVLEGLPEGGRARIHGRIEPVPVGWKTMKIPFRGGRRWAMTVPWGDLASGYYSTGIPNIEVYFAMPRRRIAWAKRLRFLLPMFKWKWLARMAERRIESKVSGPTAEERGASRSWFWGQITDANGQSVSATLETPSGYELTMLTAVACLERVLAGTVPKGFATPSKAFGAEFILSIPGAADFRWETPSSKS